LLANNNKESAKNKADSLIDVIAKGAGFSKVATENSLDQNPNVIPGELGWMTQAMMIPGFEGCFEATLNKLFTVESNYGLHIVKVSQKTKLQNKAQVAILEKEAIASRETFQKYYSQANELASKSDGKIDKFNELTTKMGLVPLQASNIQEGAKSIASYKNTREITRWAYDSKLGDVSQIISVDNKYFFIVALTGIRDAGIPTLAAVESEITAELRRVKSQEKMRDNVKERIAGLTSLEEIADKLGTTVSNQSGVSFGAPGSQSFDPKFIGYVAGAGESTLVGPVAGSVGVYIFKVDSRDTGSFFTEDDAKMRSNQMLNYQIQMLPAILEKNAKVKDHRTRFF
jgi:peptidyl-prolyl cis-trans isomerase D